VCCAFAVVAEILHRTVANVSVIFMLGRRYTVRGDSMEVCAPVTQLGRCGTQQNQIVVFPVLGSSVFVGHRQNVAHRGRVCKYSTKVKEFYCVKNIPHFIKIVLTKVIMSMANISRIHNCCKQSVE